MMTIFSEYFKASFWYNSLSNYTFPSVFVKLSEEDKALLSDGVCEGERTLGAAARLKGAMKAFSGSKFVSVDCAAPTDTERFASKNGAVYSAESAWKYLGLSEKVRKSVASGQSDHICVRPYRRMNCRHCRRTRLRC